MKKIIISMMAAMMSVFSFAADDAVARITLTGTTSGGQAQIILIENASYSAGYDNGYDAPCNINLAEDLPKTLHIYSYIGANKYSTIATNNLDGLHVDFITNLLDDEYTMTFEVFTLAPGRTLDIYDLDENQRTDIDPSESYTFNATSGHNEIKDRFIINYVAPTVQMANDWDDNWSSPETFTDNHNGTASLTKNFTSNGYFNFKMVEDDNWLSNNETFKRDYTAATGINGNLDNMTLWIDVPGDYTFTWTYETNKLEITMPTLPSVQMKGSWDSWADFVDFTPAADGLSASANLHLDPADWYQFKVALNGTDWRSFEYVDAASAFTRANNSHNWINANHTDNMTINADVAGDYTFTWTFVENKLTITFPAVAPATGYTVTPNAAGYATFSAAEATVIPTGATAYTGTISGEELVLNQIMGGYVPANTGVIVAGVAGTPYNFAIYDGSVAAIADNALKATATYNTSMKNVYVLKGNAFLEYVGTNALAANKAYIQLPEAGPNNAPKRIRMVINGATDVENVQGDNVQCTKIIENGQIYILHNGAKYNVQGQIVQ